MAIKTDGERVMISMVMLTWDGDTIDDDSLLLMSTSFPIAKRSHKRDQLLSHTDLHW